MQNSEYKKQQGQKTSDILKYLQHATLEKSNIQYSNNPYIKKWQKGSTGYKDAIQCDKNAGTNGQEQREIYEGSL